MKLIIVAAGTLFLSWAAAAEPDWTVSDVQDQTTAGRKLLKAARPAYPQEERGRWTESCVALFFKVRPDGKTDEFVVLEAPRYKRPRESELQTGAEKAEESRNTRLFVQPAIKALFDWQYAPAAKPTDEIAVFRYERTEMGGHLMRLSIRRLDLGTAKPRACTTTLDLQEVRALVAKARAG
jgi:hypothetical protein